MADYIAAFKQGLAAAEEAQLAVREIDEVFATLNHEMQKASGGKIFIERQDMARHLKVVFEALTMDSGNIKQNWYIIAHNPTVADRRVEELAKWEQGRHGYPCKISWEDVVLYCEDRKALEISLAALLSDPLIATKLSGLMGLETPPPPIGSIQNGAQSCAP